MVRVPAYISKIISAAADEGPDEMMCFPAGLHYFLNKNVQNITEIDVSHKVYANFSEKGRLYIAIYANFSKREKEWIGRPAGKHISPRPSSATEIIGNCLSVSQTYHFS